MVELLVNASTVGSSEFFGASVSAMIVFLARGGLGGDFFFPLSGAGWGNAECGVYAACRKFRTDRVYARAARCFTMFRGQGSAIKPLI